MIKTIPLSSRAKTTSLKQPKELFTFARTIDGEYEYDERKVRDEHLLYYYFPDSYVDKQTELGGGFNTAKMIPEQENLGDFGALLKAVMKYEQMTCEKVRTDVITFRGLMTKILTLPYNLRDSLNLEIVAFDGQLFIKNNDDMELKKRLQERESQAADPTRDEYVRRCEYSGYKFEAVTTLPRPWSECSRQTIEKRHKKVVNNYEQYLSVVRTGIGKCRLLLAGEVDSIWDYLPEEGDPLPHYVELKTSKAVESAGQAVNFEKKLFKTWAQCFLIGIRRIVYGFRDDNLVLRNTEVYTTDEIPLMLKDSVSNNQKIVCMNALKWYGAVIEWLMDVIPRDEYKLWSLTYDPGSSSFFVAEDVANDKRKDSIVPAEFREWRASLKKMGATN